MNEKAEKWEQEVAYMQQQWDENERAHLQQVLQIENQHAEEVKSLNQEIDKAKQDFLKLENENKALAAENQSNIERADKWKNKYTE